VKPIAMLNRDALDELARPCRKIRLSENAWNYARTAVQSHPRNRRAHHQSGQLERRNGQEQIAQREFTATPSLSQAELEHDIFQLAEPGGKSKPSTDEIAVHRGAE